MKLRVVIAARVAAPALAQAPEKPLRVIVRIVADKFGKASGFTAED